MKKDLSYLIIDIIALFIDSVLIGINIMMYIAESNPFNLVLITLCCLTAMLMGLLIVMDYLVKEKKALKND